GKENGIVLDYHSPTRPVVKILQNGGETWRIWRPGKAESEEFKVESLDVYAKDRYPIKNAKYYGEVGGIVVAANDDEQVVCTARYENARVDYIKLPFSFPPGAKLGTPDHDYGLRFVDIDEDGHPDIIFSNEKEYGVYLYTDMEHGWSRKVM